MPTSNKKLQGKVAIVTGASKGIGAAIAKHLADAGASVIVNYASSKTGADRVVAEITAAGCKAVAIQADVSKHDDIRRLFTETKKAFDRVDVLVNNAGVYDFAPIEEVTADLYHRMFDLNVLGLLLASQEAVRHFGTAGGAIINIGSIAGKLGLPGGSVYCATKAAVDAVTRCLATELGPRNIRVNAVNPGMVETEGVKAKNLDSGAFKDQQVMQTPLGRIAVPDDIAPAVVFLASPDSGWITGESLYLTGGLR